MFESGLSGRLSGVHGPDFFEADEERNFTHGDVGTINGLSMTKPLRYTEIELGGITSAETKLATTDEIVYKVEVNSRSHDKIYHKTK